MRMHTAQAEAIANACYISNVLVHNKACCGVREGKGAGKEARTSHCWASHWQEDAKFPRAVSIPPLDRKVSLGRGKGKEGQNWWPGWPVGCFKLRKGWGQWLQILFLQPIPESPYMDYTGRDPSSPIQSAGTLREQMFPYLAETSSCFSCLAGYSSGCLGATIAQGSQTVKDWALPIQRTSYRVK